MFAPVQWCIMIVTWGQHYILNAHAAPCTLNLAFGSAPGRVYFSSTHIKSYVEKVYSTANINVALSLSSHLLYMCVSISTLMFPDPVWATKPWQATKPRGMRLKWACMDQAMLLLTALHCYIFCVVALVCGGVGLEARGEASSWVVAGSATNPHNPWARAAKEAYNYIWRTNLFKDN